MNNAKRIQYIPNIHWLLAFTVYLSTGMTMAQTNYRILFAYNQFVENVYPDLIGKINLAVAETNQAYINSGIDARMTLARTVKVTYTPIDPPDVLLTHFREAENANSDMDEIFALRDENAADICILLMQPGGFCGVTSGFGVNQANAFAGVDAGCLTGIFTPAHEVGHLFGGRHQLGSDNTNTPFPDGHGYTGPRNDWKTILSDAPFITRLQYFSNPNINNPSTGEPMGNAVSANVSRVHNARAGIVANFRTLPTELVLQTQGVKAYEYSHVQASGSVTLPVGFAVENGGQLLIEVATSGLGKQGAVEPKPILTNAASNQPSIRTTSQGIEVKMEFEPLSKIYIEIFNLMGQITIEKTLYSIPNGDHGLLLPKNWFEGQGRILRVKDENGRNLLQKMVIYPSP
jgi:hypothetical protein